MSQIYASAIVVVLSQVLPLIGVSFGNDQLTNLAQALVAIGAGIWVMVRRHQQGDINAAGIRTN